MTRKQLQILVEQSYTGHSLDGAKVEQLTSKLSHKDLRGYIRLLKKREQEQQVHVALPVASVYNQNVNKVLLEVFPDKEILIEEDALLLLGAKITANDMVYEMSLRSRLEDFIEKVEQLYD